jgi:hypothetical protein
LSARGRFQQFCLSHFSKPVGDRPIYRAIREAPPRHLLEIGLASALRTERMIELTLACRRAEPLSYTGIDQFEARTSGRTLSLKQTYQALRGKLAKVRLIPGDPYSALAQAANSLVGVDLVVIAADQAGEALERAWFYLPRTLAAGARIFVEQGKGESALLVEMPRSEVDRRAAALVRRAA